MAVGNSIFETIAMTVTVEDLDSGAAFEIGTDYCVYICDPTNGDETVDGDEVFKVSKSSTYPSGYTAANSRKIGGFHYGVVRRVNEQGNPVNSSGAERGSGWESCVYNGILPNSVWTVLHRPKCDPAGVTSAAAYGATFIFRATTERTGCNPHTAKTRSRERRGLIGILQMKKPDASENDCRPTPNFAKLLSGRRRVWTKITQMRGVRWGILPEQNAGR